MNVSNIPAADRYKDVPQFLKDLPIWVVFAKCGKRPYAVDDFDRFGWSNPKKLRTFNQAVKRLGEAIFARDDDDNEVRSIVSDIGVIIYPGCGAGASDADTHHNPLNTKFVDRFKNAGAYVEASRSGTGRHSYFKYTGPQLPKLTENRSIDLLPASKSQAIIVTGICVENAGSEVDLTDEMPSVCAEFKETTSENNVHSGGLLADRYLKSEACDDFKLFLRRFCSEMLKHLSADSYDDWMKIGACLQYEGFSWEMYDAWSRKSNKYKDTKDTISKWRSFRRTPEKNPDDAIANGLTLLSMALKAGWKPPAGRSDLIPDYLKGYTGVDEHGEVCPRWINRVFDKEGNLLKQSINEPVFCMAFMLRNGVYRVNGTFYNIKNEAIEDDRISSNIQHELMGFFPTGLATKTRNLLYALQNLCYTPVPEPDSKHIYLANNTTLSIVEYDKQKYQFRSSYEDTFTVNRLAVKYVPGADCPIWKKAIDELFYSEEAAVVQEYLGYCLIPATFAQVALFISGPGGEGKSIIGAVLEKILGNCFVNKSVADLQNDKFATYDLEHKLVSYDDDMALEKFSETNILKQIITLKGKMSIQKKGVQARQARLYARIIGMSNGTIGAKFDHSDGFYRRQLLIECKPKTRTKDDPFFLDKLEAELPGIFNWMLEGLRRFLERGGTFVQTERMSAAIAEAKANDNNVLSFVTDDKWIVVTGDKKKDQIPSSELQNVYINWCRDNGEDPYVSRNFSIRFAAWAKRMEDVEKSSHVIVIERDGTKKQVNGYAGIKFGPDALRL